MKQVSLFLAIIIGLILFSCEPCAKPGPILGTLDGKWRMIIVKDNLSRLIITKPASIVRDVNIEFTSTSPTNESFSGNTPSNMFWANFSTTNQDMTVTFFSMSKVGETTWGDEFIDNIHSTQSYSFEKDGNLSIQTTKKILTFERLQ